MSIFTICLGIGLALAGAYLLSKSFVNDIGQLASAPGGWSENRDEWDALKRKIQKRNRIGFALIVAGMALQIFVGVPVRKASRFESFMSKIRSSGRED